MRLPTFVSGSYPSQSSLLSQRTVNWYVEQIQVPQATNQAALYPIPGQTPLMTLTDSGARALFTMAGRTHGVIGGGVYELFPMTGTSTRRATVTQDANLATISYNGKAGNQLFLTTGANGYYLNLTTNAVTQVSGLTATMGGMIDGYFVAFDGVQSQYRISPLNDTAGVWDPTQFLQRSIAPDPWKAMVIDGNRQIWLIGEESGEVHYDAGSFPFPFAPIPGAVFPYGTCAPFSVAVCGDRVIWLHQALSGAGRVIAASGYVPQPISSTALDTAIATYARTAGISDARAMVFDWEGHLFYVLTFPAAAATWAYDLTTNIWIELGKWNNAANDFLAWAPAVHTYANGVHVVGDGSNVISTLDIASGTESDGTAIRRLRRAPGIVYEYRQLTYKRLQLFLESGVGTQSGQGSNPMVMLRISDDGGKTWGNLRQANAGKVGQYSQRPFWTRLGVSRDRVFEITVSDPVPWRLIDAYINSDSQGQGQAA